MNLVLLALLLLLPRTIGAEETTPPEPPAGQVLDHSGWLDASSARRLEAELGRLRHEHQVDVCVVIWDQSLPGDLDHESFARQLGSTWARENLWAVVLKEPGSDTPPAVAYSGSPLDRPGADAAVPAIETAIAQGLQDCPTGPALAASP